MVNIIKYLDFIFGSFYFLLAIVAGSLVMKLYILCVLIKNGYQIHTIARKPWFFLLCGLISAMVVDFSWVLRLAHGLFTPWLDYSCVRFTVRIAWAFSIVQYHGFGLFLESLVSRNFYLKIHQKVFVFISTIFFIFGTGTAFIFFNQATTPIELSIHNTQFFYMALCTILPSLILVIYSMRKYDIPLILKKQLNIFIKGFIVPYLLIDFMQLYPFNTALNLVLTNYSVVSVSTIIITYGMFFCSKQVMGFRFLNFQSHVLSGDQLDFVVSFKQALEQLGNVTNIQELHHITQTFFKEAFGVPPTRTGLIVRKFSSMEKNEFASHASMVETMIENFMSVHSSSEEAKKSKVLIYDEIAFNNFYEQNQMTDSMVLFLDNINADIFIPICDQGTIIGGIIVERHARLGRFYSEAERDQMHMFAGYLGAIIKLIQHKNIDSALVQEKEMRETIFTNQLEMAHYKESVQTFLRASRKAEEGIIFYKNRQFSYGNQAAKDFVGIDLNIQGGHPITQSLKKLIYDVQEYKKFQSTFVQGVDDTMLVVYGIPSLNGSMVIITIGYPDIGDIIKKI